ncbi:MAG: hypothetical protein ACRD7F_00950 [Nitrososphaeraceae archaeon]
MIRRDIISVIGDMENFLDSLLLHTEEENCNHSVSDFLQEYFDNKNKNKNKVMASLGPQQDNSAIQRQSKAQMELKQNYG